MLNINRLLRAPRVHWNQFLQISSYENRDLRSLGKPVVFQIEPTNHCNLRCPMCPHDLMTREIGFMDLALFKRAVDQVRDHSAHIRLHNMGESLFHKKIDQFISYAHQNGLKTTLSSNASALTERAAARILGAGLDELLISFDGATKETYEACREGADYAKVLRNIERFLEMRDRQKRYRPRVTMSLINMPITANEVSDFKARWERRVDAVRIKPPRNWDGSSTRINTIVGLKDMRPNQAPCSWLWTSLVVLWDGRVVPCCMDYDAKAVLGNIKAQSLAEIFNAEPMQALRRLHVEGRVNESSLCRGCSAPTGLDGPWAKVIGITSQVASFLSAHTQAAK